MANNPVSLDPALEQIIPQEAPKELGNVDPAALLAESDALAALAAADPVMGALQSVANAQIGNREGDKTREVITGADIRAKGLGGVVTGAGPRKIFLWRKDTGMRLELPIEQARRIMFAPVISMIPVNIQARPGILCEECELDDEIEDAMVRVDWRVSKAVERTRAQAADLRAKGDNVAAAKKEENAERIIQRSWAVHMWGFHRSEVWLHTDDKLPNTLTMLENLQRTPNAQP